MTPRGILAISDVQIPCCVLEDGTRVIHQRGMVSSLGMSRGGSSRGGGDRLAYFVAQKTLSPYVSSELMAVTKEPLLFRTDKGAMAETGERLLICPVSVWKIGKRGFTLPFLSVPVRLSRPRDL